MIKHQRLQNCEECFKVKVFCVTVDVITNQIESRFQGIKEVAERFKCLFPKNLAKMSEDQVCRQVPCL